MRATRGRGFTLIELLVVIAIIAVLAGILFPVFAMVRRKARMAADSANLHQLAAALATYMQDYNQMPPPDLSVLAKGAPMVAPGDLKAKKDASRKFSYLDDGYGDLLYNRFGLDANGYGLPQTVYYDVARAGGAVPPAFASHGINTWPDFPMMMNRQRPKNTIVTWSPYNREVKGALTPPYTEGTIIVLRVDGSAKVYAGSSGDAWLAADTTSGLTKFEHQTAW